MFPNENMKLWPGGFVNVRLRVDTRRNATVVPPAAIQRGPLGTYVYVVGDSLTASRRPVEVGHEDLHTSIIDSGLHPGERVVIDGAARLSDGRAVSIVPTPGVTPATASRPASGGAT
jgi:multidrug efflux system membrane fusion protein